MTTQRNLTYAAAIDEATCLAMERDNDIFAFGIGVDYSSAVFGSMHDANARFPDRVMDTPAMENSLTGIAIGAAAAGKRPLMIHLRNDFMFLAVDQLVNLAAKWRHMYGGKAGHLPITVRGIIGRGWGQGATHSQSIQSLFAHFPGLNVVMPTVPADAKGLMLSALTAEDPVIILEHRSLYSLEGPVEEGWIPTPIGKARVAREGNDVTIVATSFMLVEAERAADELAKMGVSVEIIDLRSIRPLDHETILASVAKTGRLLVADTSWVSFGVASEVAAIVSELGFHHLKAPIVRLGMADCPAPVSHVLEQAFYPKPSTITARVAGLLDIPYTVENAPTYVDNFRGPY
ncbi:MAG: transketolase C-terminal domain-containing protein [Rhodospirillales bacterium]